MFLKTLRLPMIVIGLIAFIGSAEARDRGWEASPSVWALYDQGRGNIAGACWEAYDRDRQWRWMLFCVNHFVMNSKFKDAELFFGNAYHSALAWAEHGWGGGNKIAGCDRHWGIMGLQQVANATLSGIDGGLIRQQANNELGRIISQNPPNVLRGLWSVIGSSGRADLLQSGGAFNGTLRPHYGGETKIEYDRNAPFRRRDATWWNGDFWWYHYSKPGVLVSQGRGVVQVDNNNSCHPTLDTWTWNPATRTYGSAYRQTWMRP